MAAVKKPEFRAPRKLQFIFAVFAITFIFVLIIIMFAQIAQKASDLAGLQAPAVTGNCTDTDSGNLPNEFGTCTDSTRQSKSDTCVLSGLREPLKLQEWFCNTTTNACDSEIKVCNPGFICQAGKCIKA